MADRGVVQVLAVVTVHICVRNSVNGVRLLNLVQLVGFRRSHMNVATRPTTEHSAVGIPHIPPSIILQL